MARHHHTRSSCSAAVTTWFFVVHHTASLHSPPLRRRVAASPPSFTAVVRCVAVGLAGAPAAAARCCCAPVVLLSATTLFPPIRRVLPCAVLFSPVVVVVVVPVLPRPAAAVLLRRARPPSPPALALLPLRPAPVPVPLPPPAPLLPVLRLALRPRRRPRPPPAPRVGLRRTRRRRVGRRRPACTRGATRRVLSSHRSRLHNKRRAPWRPRHRTGAQTRRGLRACAPLRLPGRGATGSAGRPAESASCGPGGSEKGRPLPSSSALHTITGGNSPNSSDAAPEVALEALQRVHRRRAAGGVPPQARPGERLQVLHRRPVPAESGVGERARRPGSSQHAGGRSWCREKGGERRAGRRVVRRGGGAHLRAVLVRSCSRSCAIMTPKEYMSADTP